MKTTKINHNFLKYYLLKNKAYKSFSIKQNFQLVYLKNLELQLKKIIKLFFKTLFKISSWFNFNLYYTLLNQCQQKPIFYENKLLNLNLFIYFFKKQQINWNIFNRIFNYTFTQLFCFFSVTYKKQQKISKILGNLTNIIISNNFCSLKKTKNFFYYNYLFSWNSRNSFFILQLFYFLILKLKKI